MSQTQMLTPSTHSPRRATAPRRPACGDALALAAEELLREMAFVYQLTRRVEKMLTRRSRVPAGRAPAPVAAAVE
jgi:hypothetical protein